jgi:hypothetical protein
VQAEALGESGSDLVIVTRINSQVVSGVPAEVLAFDIELKVAGSIAVLCSRREREAIENN